MKILAIRGENLASLQGSFSIDLSLPPFDRAGLFAITGPTGAGKSTLLDAICLALYGTTPRMNSVKGRGHVVGAAAEEQRILSNDERALLRKGCGEGFAEVEFLGRDGKRYRARWTVRRARGRIDGRFQAAAAELWDVETDAPIGRTKTDVYAAVEEKVGLSYEQFCRSVLLAQGEFARFLLAGEKERAELLERVTGTEIYRQISILAHERLGEERKLLQELERELQGVPILAPAERQALEEAAVSREQEKKDAEQAWERAEATLGWFRRHGELLEREAEARREVDAAEAAWKESEEQRGELEAVEAVLPLRPLLASVESAQRKAADTSRAREEAAAAVVAAAQAREARAGEVQEGERLLHRTRATIEGELPALEEARRLEAKVEGGRQMVVRSATSLQHLRAQSTRQADEVAGIQLQLDRAAASLHTAASWLASHGSLESVAGQWERWREEALRHVAGLALVSSLESRLSVVGSRRGELDRSLLELDGKASQSRELLAGAEAAAGEAEAALASLPRKQWRGFREALAAEEQASGALENLVATSSRLAFESAQQKERLANLHTEAGEAKEASISLEAQWKLLSTQLVEAEEQLRQARAVVDLTDRRSELADGAPCPLCGATEHPYASEAIRGDERVKERRERVEALTQTREETRGLLARAKARWEAAAQASENLSRERERLESDRSSCVLELDRAVAGLSALQGERRRLGLALGLPGGAASSLPGDGASVPPERWPLLFAEWTRERKAQVEALTLHEKEADGLEEKARRARSEVDACRRNLDRLATERDAVRDTLRKAELEAKEAESALVSATAQVDGAKRILTEAMAAFPGWEERLVAEGRGWIDALSTSVGTWKQNDTLRKDAQATIERLNPLLENGKSLLAERREAEQAAAKELTEAEEALRQMTVARMALLQGRSVAEVEKSQKERLEAAEKELGRARTLAQAAESAWARASANLESAEKEAARSVEEAALRAKEWEASLLATGLQAERVHGWLAIPDERLSVWRRARDEGSRRRDRARALFEQRSQDRTAHESSESPSVDREEAVVAQKAAWATRELATERWHDTRKALENDDLAREKGAAILPRICAQQLEVEKWAKLHELIGAASGDKFQLFAQSLTLEALLSHANVHLEQLAPRYRLERVPGHDLELQIIDRDMADEVRAVNSLSGGESFLVSLALALGLSGLSARSTPVESLFIDEGFGTLDPQTLDTALATLDALQASGRKVGVISHVQGMAERIGVQIRVVPRGRGTSRVEVVVQ